MKSQNFIPQESYRRLAQKVKADLTLQKNSLKTSIFICGADINDKEKTRYKVTTAFSDKYYSQLYNLFFPEGLFDELLYSNKGPDLLSLENILAESIDVIIIIPESPGSFAELGAFANDENLRGKIVCLVDEKYIKDRSFINKGPVKIIKDKRKSAIVYIDPDNLGKSISKINNVIRDIKKSTIINPDSINLLQLDGFLLPLIYLLEPVNKDIIENCVEVVINNLGSSSFITQTVLTMMVKNKVVELTPEGYKLTKLGTKEILVADSIKSFKKDYIAKLDDLRLQILSMKLRKKRLTI